jgi:hypothetical protein
MIPETLRIDELLLRLPGLDEAQARQIAEEVSARLAEAVGRTDMFPVPAGAVLSVRIPAETPAAELTETITRRILEALR